MCPVCKKVETKLEGEWCDHCTRRYYEEKSRIYRRRK